VMVTVTDPFGRKGSATVRLFVRNRQPQAVLAFSPSDPTVLTSVQFKALSGDADGVVGRWLWDFGDGNQSTGPAARHLYVQKGNFTVTLSVQDDSGAWSDEAVQNVHVRNIPPVARASPPSAKVQAGGSVRLDASHTLDPDDPASVLAFRWDSLDGWYSISENVTRRFATPGRYRMTLTVTDSSGASSQDTVTVQVMPVEGSGGNGYRSLATGLSVAAVLVFAIALYIFGKDRMGYAPKMAPMGAIVNRAGSGKTKRPKNGPS